MEFLKVGGPSAYDLLEAWQTTAVYLEGIDNTAVLKR
jgi:hypothetical protein